MPHALKYGLPRDFLRPCLLLLLREGEAHGYELLGPIESFGFDSSDPGALYRALRRLETDGMVRSIWEQSEAGPQKRVYAITEAGVVELDKWATGLAEGERRIDGFLDRYLRARRLADGNPKRRAVAGRIAAHRAAARNRQSLDLPGPAHQ